MELTQGMKNKEEMKKFQKQIQKWNVNIIGASGFMVESRLKC